MTSEESCLRAYHGKKSVKQKYVNRMKAHIEADELIHGSGWDGTKGCAVGCTLNKYNHACYQVELGLPEWLAQLEDRIFESMSVEKSKTFPLEFLQAIPIGANLDKTYHKFCKYILTDIAKDCDEEPVRKAIELVLSQHEKAIRGEIMTIPAIGRIYQETYDKTLQESAAESAAWSASESAAWSAARSAAESAAWSAARSAARSASRSAARSASESAAWSAARSAAWSAAFDKMADKLIELLKESEA